MKSEASEKDAESIVEVLVLGGQLARSHRTWVVGSVCRPTILPVLTASLSASRRPAPRIVTDPSAPRRQFWHPYMILDLDIGLFRLWS